MLDEQAVVPVGRLLRELLDLDRSLSPTERKLLEVLLMRPPSTTARDLSRATATNLQALYAALDRLIERGLVAAERTGSTTRFRVAHPSVVLQTLVEPGMRAAALAKEVEGPLRSLYERDDLEGLEEPGREARSTSSATAAASWLLDLVASASSEVWFLGDEAPWFRLGGALEAEIEKRGRTPQAVQVRLLLPKRGASPLVAERQGRLQRIGAEVRRSDRFSSPTVVVDRRWMMIENAASKESRSVFVRLDAPNLCRDLLAAADEAWIEAGAERSSPTPVVGNGARGKSIRAH